MRHQPPTTALALAALLLAPGAGVAQAADATGTWRNADGDAIIRIADCATASGRLCGTVVWLRTPVDPATGGPQTDRNNKDPALRSRPILGLRAIMDMRPSGTAGKWDGRVYDIDSGKTYDGNLILKGENELRVQGCVMLVCDGETWTRAAPPAAQARPSSGMGAAAPSR